MVYARSVPRSHYQGVKASRSQPPHENHHVDSEATQDGLVSFCVYLMIPSPPRKALRPVPNALPQPEWRHQDFLFVNKFDRELYRLGPELFKCFTLRTGLNITAILLVPRITTPPVCITK